MCVMCGKTYAGKGSLFAHIWKSKLHADASRSEKVWATVPTRPRLLRGEPAEPGTVDNAMETWRVLRIDGFDPFSTSLEGGG